MDIVSILTQLQQINALDASLYGAAVGLGILLRFARAAWFHFNDAQTGAACIALGVVGAVSQIALLEHPWGFIVFQSLMLGVGVAVVELALRKAADKISWLPSDNQWSSNPKIDPNDPANKEVPK